MSNDWFQNWLASGESSIPLPQNVVDLIEREWHQLTPERLKHLVESHETLRAKLSRLEQRKAPAGK